MIEVNRRVPFDYLKVLINEPTETLMPSYVTLNLDVGDQKKSIQISHKCVDTMRGTCKKRHEWFFTSPTIKGVSLYKQDARCILLYVHENSDDFQMFFPSSAARERFYQVSSTFFAQYSRRVFRHPRTLHCALCTPSKPIRLHEATKITLLNNAEATSPLDLPQVVQEMINENQQNEDSMCLAFDYDAQFQCIDFEYDLDENRQKKVLGKGMF